MSTQDHVEQLITTYRKRLNKLELQVAKFDSYNVPSHFLLEINEINEIIARLQAQPAARNQGATDAQQGYATPNTLRDLATEMERPPKHLGLMVFVGPGRVNTDPKRQSAGEAIQYHLGELKHCWLLVGETSPENVKPDHRGAIDIARELERYCKDNDVKAYIWPVAEPFSAQSTYELLQVLFATQVRKAQLAPNQVISDFTGGTKPMSAGMILACGTQRPMQYMIFAEDRSGSIPLLVRFANEDSL